MNDDEIFMDHKTILVKLNLKPSENIKEHFDLLGNALIYTQMRRLIPRLCL